MNLVLPVTADAGSFSFFTGGNTGTLSLVGLVTTETVSVQIPRVESPADDNAAHWTAMMQETYPGSGVSVPVTLHAGHNVIRIPARLNILLNKPAGVAGNAYGVRWS